MKSPPAMRRAVESVLRDVDSALVAVSGGVDSLTLATLAGRLRGFPATMVHAVSPAVPPRATARVRELADREGWRLRVLNAGEFSDPRYLTNPVDRCFYCKQHLYGALAALDGGTVLSGTNLDDLGDYRPGLQAAAERGVRHPFVEAGIDKAGVRRLAGELGLGALSRLPAAPCLSSRVETGRPIDAGELAFADRIENLIRDRYGLRVVRCRLRARSLEIEIGSPELEAIDPVEVVELVTVEARAAGFAEPVHVRPYRMGSAFLRDRGAA